jgi:hypothetical protein
MSTCDQLNSLGLGLIVLEKQGISQDGVDLFEYSQTNCLQKRLEDYIFCLENMHVLSPGWEGKVIFWGESEGGMLAANLAGQMPETAAVLLFGAGGGMKPREEVKWTVRHRLEEHGALQDEIDQYMSSLDEQMDAMTLDPTPNKQFFGNTYKWWASFLAADEVSMFLNQRALPIYLVHGVEDHQIPIVSADLAAEVLKEANALTYLRLEGYGHDLDVPNVQAAACQWLGSILYGQERANSNFIVSAAQSPISSFGDWQTDISHYVLSRGKGEAHAGVKGSKDSDGNESASGRVGASKETDGWGKFEADAGVGAKKDKEGNVKGEVDVEARWSRDF